MKFVELTTELQVQAYKKAKEWFEENGIYDKEAIVEYLNEKDDFEIVDYSPDEDGSCPAVEFL